MADGGPILFYDGACGLCDRSVRWTMAHDDARVFRFAPLQGRTYAALDAPGTPEDVSTLVVVADGDVLTRSDAVLYVLRRVGGVWGVLGVIGSVVPRFVRDAVYGVVARHRLRLFGGSEACRLPTAHDRERLLP